MGLHELPGDGVLGLLHKGRTTLMSRNIRILANFGMVEMDLFRSGQPNELNFPFIEKLHLRTVINLAPDELPPALLTWMEEQKVELIHLGEDVGKRSRLSCR